MWITRKIIQTFIYSQLCYYNPNETSYRIYKQFIVQYVFVVRLDFAWLNRFLIHRFFLAGVYCNCPYMVKPVLANVHKRSPKSWKQLPLIIERNDLHLAFTSIKQPRSPFLEVPMSIIVEPRFRTLSPMGQKNLVVIAGYRINGSFL